MYKLLIIEDDAAIAAAVAKLAAAWEMETHIVSDFRAVLTEYAAFAPHIVLIDISLPFFSGYHWCAELRKLSNVPNRVHLLRVGRHEHRHGDGDGRG